MSEALYNRLRTTIKARDWTEGQVDMDEMCDIYEGKVPRQFEKFFPKNSPKQLVQVIPLAWDDLSTSVGTRPDFRAEPRDRTRKELKAAGMREKIAHSYLNQALPSGEQLMHGLGWWLQLGRAIMIVSPDFDAKTPRFELRDPRTCYPGIKKSVNNVIVELEDLIFEHKLDLAEAQRRGLAPMTGDSLPQTVKVMEYIDKDRWAFVSQFGNAKTAFHGLGMVPGHVFQRFAPNSTSGKSRFKDQIALMVSISRLLSAKIAYADQLVNPILWAKGHEGTIEFGPHTLNKLNLQGEIGRINPPTQFQIDRDIEILNQFSRILNRNPEVRQGEITARGSYTSAKTLEQLSEAIDTVVGADWAIIGPGMEYLLKVAYTMEMKLWPDVEKTITGRVNGKKFLNTYIPSEDIGDRVDIKVDYGFGVGGYQGFLMHLQAKEAKTMSRRRAMEAMPGTHDVDEEMGLIDQEDMDEAGKAMFMNLAATGSLPMDIWAELREQMAQEGIPLYEVIIKFQERLAEQAQAAQQTEGDTAGLVAPPGPEEAPQEEELPGIPPQALAGV